MRRLCRLISIGKLRAPKGECFLDLTDLKEYRRGLLLIVMPPANPEDAKPSLASLGRDTWLAASMLYTGEDRRRSAGTQTSGADSARAPDCGQ